MRKEAVSYSLRQTVFGILKTLVVRALQNNLDSTYNVEPDIPDQLIGDFLRLSQVITSLVGNAIKPTPSKVSKKGRVALNTHLLALDDQSVALEFCVTDTGIGIQRHRPRSIYRIVSLMQTNMWVESEVSKGSKFYFKITSQISHNSIESTLSKMISSAKLSAKRTSRFVDTLYDKTDVVDHIQEIRLRAHVVHSASEVSDKEKYPHINSIVVDSLSMTESIHEFEHLRRYIPIVLLAPALIARTSSSQTSLNFRETRPSCCTIRPWGDYFQKLASWISQAESGSAAAAEKGGAAGEAGEGVAQVASRWPQVAKFFKVIGAIGFIVTIIVGIIEAIEEKRSSLKPFKELSQLVCA
ncbi:hypothetical protein HGRIS_001516 [Hohenbuehelia grisea]|uniref:Histidine kinase/HSP90-like ATPase domain-containing protein n=1 Tax=Hohenbuehelia grisea TaxID=104357 RepID=A0ABR3JPJ3_9AGAR